MKTAEGLKRSAGVRLSDAEYSIEYVRELRTWMIESGNATFEDDLIKSGHIALDIKNAQLGLDFILESLPPQEEMAFESGCIRYVELDPEIQFPRRFRNESLRQQKRERYVQEMELSKSDLEEVSLTRPWTERGPMGLCYSPQVFRIPEPPYADICRNSPPDLKISQLRRLREDGYFDRMEWDIQIAAYLISKGHWRHYQITTFFSHVISWEHFQSAQTIVHWHIRKTFPENFKRIETLRQRLTKKQLKAFETRYDVDIRPTQQMTADILKINLSSFKERMQNVRLKFKAEFQEFAKTKRQPFSWGQQCDLHLSGFYRKSLDFFRVGQWTNLKANLCSEVHASTFDDSKFICSVDKKVKVAAWLRSRLYPPELKTIVAGQSRGGYHVKRGEFFHHARVPKTAEIDLPEGS